MLKKLVSFVSVIAVIAAAIVVVLGAYTRLADAGLGCPDWPTCYGHLWIPSSDEDIARANQLYSDTPVENDKTWPEQIHRIFASSLGLILLFLFFSTNYLRAKSFRIKQINSVSALLVLVVLGVVFRIIIGESFEPIIALLLAFYFAIVARHALMLARYPHSTDQVVLTARVFILVSFLAGFVVLQGLFGMWTVTLKLWPQVVTAHLLGGFIIFAFITLLSINLKRPNWLGMSLSTREIWLSRIALVTVFLQIALGGWTSSNYAAMACPDLPTCQTFWLPSMDFKQGFNVFQHVGPNYLGGVMDNEARIAIHMMHRLGALLVTIILLLLVGSFWRNRSALVRRSALILLVLLVTQLLLGVSNILFSLPLSIAVLHNAVGALLFSAMVFINFNPSSLEYTGE